MRYRVNPVIVLINNGCVRGTDRPTEQSGARRAGLHAVLPTTTRNCSSAAVAAASTTARPLLCSTVRPPFSCKATMPLLISLRCVLHLRMFVCSTYEVEAEIHDG